MAPTTYTTPKILLPLVNSTFIVMPCNNCDHAEVPIIEYTLELLVQAGVKELFIVARFYSYLWCQAQLHAAHMQRRFKSTC